MTLENVYSKKRTESLLDVMPDVMSVWKVVLMDLDRGLYRAPYRLTPYKAGEQEANGVATSSCSWVGVYYNLFFHFWVNKLFVLERLNDWLESYATGSLCTKPYVAIELTTIPRVVECFIRKDWIATIGRQYGGLAVVSRKAVFPKYPENRPAGVMSASLAAQLEVQHKWESPAALEEIRFISARYIEPLEETVKELAYTNAV